MMGKIELLGLQLCEKQRKGGGRWLGRGEVLEGGGGRWWKEGRQRKERESNRIKERQTDTKVPGPARGLWRHSAGPVPRLPGEPCSQAGTRSGRPGGHAVSGSPGGLALPLASR